MTREEAISFLQRGLVGEIYDEKGYLTALGYEALEAIDSSKCQTLIPKKNGEWEFVTHYGRRFRVCSVCKAEKEDDRATGWNFCQCCGSDNRKKEDKPHGS